MSEATPSIDKQLVSALSEFGFDVERVPYTGKNKQYFAFNYATVPMNHSDDEPEYEKYLIQVHLYAPINVKLTSLVKQVKIALHDAGFIYPDTTDASGADEKHIVFETENAEAIDYGTV